MSQQEQKLTSPTSLVVDAVLVIAFFIFMYFVVAPHVQTHDAKMRLLWGGLTSAMMSAVFWLCVQMFRVVFSFQRSSRRR